VLTRTNDRPPDFLQPVILGQITVESGEDANVPTICVGGEKKKET